MGGDFDWYGIGRSVGAVGEELSAARRERLAREERERLRQEEREERERLRRERQEEREREERERRARARLEAARLRYEIALRSGDESARQAAARELEAAHAELAGTQVQLFPRQVVEGPSAVSPKTEAPVGKQKPSGPPQPTTGKPETRLVVPAESRPIVFRDFARVRGLQLTPEQDRLFGDRPVDEVLRLNDQSAKAGRPIFPELAAKPDETELLDKIYDESLRYQQLIRGARTPAELRAAVDQARRWKLDLMQRYPNLRLNERLPDFAGIGRALEQEAKAAQTAAAAAESRKKWEEELKDAYRRFQDAWKGTDQFLVEQAIADINALITVGRQSGWTTRAPLNPTQLLSRWRQEREIEMRAARARLRALESGARGGGGEVGRSYQVGPYRIERRVDRRGQMTGQYVVDTRTGVAVGWDVLRERAARGDEHARAILGFSPERRGPEPPENLSDAEIREELNQIDIDLKAPGLSPSARGDLVRRRRQLQRELERRQGRQAAPETPSVVRREPSLPRAPVDMPPTVEAGQVAMAWARTRQPVPRRLWNRLTPDEQAWLRSRGVRVEGE